MFACCVWSPAKCEYEHEPFGEDDDAKADPFAGSLKENGVLSEDTLGKLATMRGDIQGIETGVAEIEDLVTGLEAGELDIARLGELRTVMTLFEARAGKLFLQSDHGGLSAEVKNDQRKRLNALFIRIENIFDTIKQQQFRRGSVRSVKSNASEPVSSYTEPPNISEEPSVVSEKLPVFSDKSPMASEKPSLKSDKSTVASGKPPAASPKPQVVSQKTSVGSQKAQTASQKPLVASQKPYVASKKSCVASTMPLHSERKKFASAGHKFSIVSEETLMKLANTQKDLTAIQSRVTELVDILMGPRVVSVDAMRLFEMKAELSMLEAKADQLECKGIDNIYTGELVSGKNAAKESKKKQLQCLEVLFLQFDQASTIIKKRQEVLRESDSH